jgi:hypothetical protein
MVLNGGVHLHKMAAICNMAAVDFYFINSIRYHFTIIQPGWHWSILSIFSKNLKRWLTFGHLLLYVTHQNTLGDVHPICKCQLWLTMFNIFFKPQKWSVSPRHSGLVWSRVTGACRSITGMLWGEIDHFLSFKKMQNHTCKKLENS